MAGSDTVRLIFIASVLLTLSTNPAAANNFSGGGMIRILEEEPPGPVQFVPKDEVKSDAHYFTISAPTGRTLCYSPLHNKPAFILPLKTTACSDLPQGFKEDVEFYIQTIVGTDSDPWLNLKRFCKADRQDPDSLPPFVTSATFEERHNAAGALPARQCILVHSDNVYRKSILIRRGPYDPKRAFDRKKRNLPGPTYYWLVAFSYIENRKEIDALLEKTLARLEITPE
jgi:hypothetical protein